MTRVISIAGLSALLLSGCITYRAVSPPARFQGHGQSARVLHVSAEEAHRRCGGVHPHNPTGIAACTFSTPRSCLIVIGHGSPTGTEAHERAHCHEGNRPGWSGAHEQ